MRVSIESLATMSGGSWAVPPKAPHLITGVTWDSREVNPKDAYLALVGERVDGHDFASAAIKAGAACLIASHPLSSEALEEAAAHDVAVLMVDDGPSALVRLAASWRAELSAPVIAVTGSSGKTTTKNLLAGVLGSQLKVVATEANQNNELGVPRTILRADPDDEAVVVEMGMRGQGQIAELCSFVKPDIALITNVGTSHIELLGSREAIARAKAEALAALPASGWAVLGADNPFIPLMLSETRCEERGIRLALFGRDPLMVPADRPPELIVEACHVELDPEGKASFELRARGDAAPVKLGLAGLHNVNNATAVAAVALMLGMDLPSIARALGEAKAAAGRQRMLRLSNGVVLVDDAYNANPDSMEASLRSFAALQGLDRRIAILGDMGELGDFGPEAHASIGRLVADLGFDELLCVGELSALMARAARAAGMASVEEVADAEAALTWARAELEPGDGLVVKASHAVGLDRVVEGLIADA